MMALIVPSLLATLSPYARSPLAGTVRTAASAGKATVLTSKLPHDHRSAQDDAHVHLKGYNATELYSGFFEIDAATGSNSFFIYSTPVSGRTDAPVLLWLNGGPGASSLLGFFDELGPFGISEKLEIEPRAVGWALDAHLIAIDNPLGVGYSHTSVLERMATNQTTVGGDLYEALHQFFQLFPNLRANALYVTGESYAGKYVPACAYTIHERNQLVPADERINLAGIAIGDGAFDPPTQFTGFGPLLFNLGLADTRAAKVYDQYDVRLTAALAAGDLLGAFRSFDEMLNGDYWGTDRTYYHNTTGMGSNYFNFALEPGAASLTKRAYPEWLALPEVAAMLHVGDTPYSVFNQTVEDRLMADWMVGVVPWLQVLLDKYDVLIYSGQYDVILGPPGTERAVDKLVWSGAADFGAAPTVQVIDEQRADLLGYARQAKSASNTTFSYVMLRGCGHMVPTDQPERAYTMLQRFLVPMAGLPPPVPSPPPAPASDGNGLSGGAWAIAGAAVTIVIAGAIAAPMYLARRKSFAIGQINAESLLPARE